MIVFAKYHGTGNDFILIDNRKAQFDVQNTRQVALMCHRHFGIGADGLILLEQPKGQEYFMRYYNSDGSQSTMCGNGGRCFAQYARALGLAHDTFEFNAIDGPHKAVYGESDEVELGMMDCKGAEKIGSDYFIDTGSPHYIRFVQSAAKVELLEAARAVRYNERFQAEGVNFNHVERVGERSIYVRTYERGVEDETLSCGTGVTAAALITASVQELRGNDLEIRVGTPGGNLKVRFDADGSSFGNIRLIGPAVRVFDGVFKV